MLPLRPVAKGLELRLRRIGRDARAEQPVHEGELEAVVAVVAGMVQVMAPASLAKAVAKRLREAAEQYERAD